MEKRKSKMWGFVGRFVLLHVGVYSVTAWVFLNAQTALPAAGRVALDFFEPYSLSLNGTLTQIAIGAVMAFVLYPFYDTIVKGQRGGMVLFAALWGVALLGSLEPKPGTIEGMIYTQTTFGEHALVLVAGVVQVLVFAWLFLRWEKRYADANGSSGSVLTERVRIQGYAGRFTLLHMLVYLAVGILFYNISGYEEALATMEVFELWRPQDNLIAVGTVFFGQIARGAILALMLLSFYRTYMNTRKGWLLLFGLLFGLKVLATVTSVPATSAEFIQGVRDSMTGLPEITAQTLVFASLFFSWERKRIKKQRIAESAGPSSNTHGHQHEAV